MQFPHGQIKETKPNQTKQRQSKS